MAPDKEDLFGERQEPAPKAIGSIYHKLDGPSPVYFWVALI